MTDTATHASRNAVRKHKLSFVVAGIAGVFMALTGALSTDAAPIVTRLIFWIIVMEAGALIGMAVEIGIASWGRLAKWPMLEGGLVAVLIALPLTLVVTSMRSLSFDLPMPSSSGMVMLFGYVLLVSLMMTALGYGLFRDKARVEHEPAPAQSVNPVTDNRFRDRLPAHLRQATILAAQSEDHYLRVHCDGGDALILMRLSDAIAELAAMDGAQTHRSWWVARSAIVSASRGEGKAVLILSNGVEAPVSRGFYKGISEAGWLR